MALGMQQQSYSPTDTDYGLLNFAGFAGRRSIFGMVAYM
jgi:hypothetical protein